MAPKTELNKLNKIQYFGKLYALFYHVHCILYNWCLKWRYCLKHHKLIIILTCFIRTDGLILVFCFDRGLIQEIKFITCCELIYLQYFQVFYASLFLFPPVKIVSFSYFPVQIYFTLSTSSFYHFCIFVFNIVSHFFSFDFSKSKPCPLHDQRISIVEVSDVSVLRSGPLQWQSGTLFSHARLALMQGSMLEDIVEKHKLEMMGWPHGRRPLFGSRLYRNG